MSMDEKATITYWNPGAARIFGRPATEVTGQAASIAMFGASEVVNRAPSDETFEVEGKRKDGTSFPLELSLSSWTNTQGAKSFTVIARDITARKQAARALEAKAEELARSNYELEQFAYVASHDLQEPLRMVSNYTQLLGQRYRDKLDGDANEFIDFAVEGAKRMQELIHDLLQYARVGTRGKEFRLTSLNKIASEAAANLSSAIDEARADVDIEPLPSVLCDATQLTQVFQNLIGNAVKFRRPDVPPVVRVKAARTDSGWTVSVADNGIGIEPKYFERIFQMFQRLHGRGDYPGTGIGLALCKKIVERHGGRMLVTSEPGKGAVFSFTLKSDS
jgi:PAS domain S-box-containing protein